MPTCDICFDENVITGGGGVPYLQSHTVLLVQISLTLSVMLVHTRVRVTPGEARTVSNPDSF